MPDLLAGAWHALPFKPFKPGIEIFRFDTHAISRPTEGAEQALIDNQCAACEDEPAIALLRYAAGASVPTHRHVGVESILVLAGSQSDEAGTYRSNSFVINPVGSVHSVWSDNGCVVLIQWDKPVQFLDSDH